MGDRVEPAANDIVVQPPVPQLQDIQNDDLRRASDFLLDNVRIDNFRTHYDKYRRYVTLHTNQLFTQLVVLYDSLFRSQWQHFKRLMDQFQAPAAVQASTYAARIYVSTWLLDSYCSIREAVRVISPLAFNERYSQEIIPYSTEYDAFLTLINASLRPTHIQLTSEDALYIPVLTETYTWDGAESDLNPFGIANFKLCHDIFYGIMYILKERKEWKIMTLSTNAVGRPFWLFDWHEGNQVCSWFPRERNFNNTDVALAYIIGVACTPKLGPRDVDDWQFPESGILPMQHQLDLLERVIARRFYGSYEVRTLETDHQYRMPDYILIQLGLMEIDTTSTRRGVKRLRTVESSSGAQTETALATTSTPATGDEATVLPNLNRYRIVDWCYHSRVIVNMEWHTRTGALRTICMN